MSIGLNKKILLQTIDFNFNFEQNPFMDPYLNKDYIYKVTKADRLDDYYDYNNKTLTVKAYYINLKKSISKSNLEKIDKKIKDYLSNNIFNK